MERPFSDAAPPPVVVSDTLCALSEACLRSTLVMETSLSPDGLRLGCGAQLELKARPHKKPDVTMVSAKWRTVIQAETMAGLHQLVNLLPA